MKSYSQFSESLNDFYLKEWEKLDEDTQKEIIEQFAEENNIELSEEEINEICGTGACVTAPIWGPPLVKAGALTLGALGIYQGNKHLKNRQQEKENERWLETGKFESSNIPKSSRTDAQRDASANVNNKVNNKVTTNNTPDPSNNPNNKPPKPPNKLKQFSNFLNSGNKLWRGTKKGLTAFTGGWALNQADRARRALNPKDKPLDTNLIK